MGTIIQASDLTRELLKKRTQKNALIANPKTGKLSYGMIPANKSGIPEGNIFLKLGDTGFGPQRSGAYGARHIWDKHQADLCLTEPLDIVTQLQEILVSGTDILVNLAAKHNPARPVILNTKIGRVALQLQMISGVASYSIISAYGAKNATGTVIGTLKNPND
ncbi:hypothetical protein [Grimontia hollisae]|uniref:hypothetical protein n=1 Tax=Grimontia hollisae TaxID=673 RepID=UPI00058C05C5|nr:hypothetical protein [Grimontia hollisae]STO79488.1 Uncharacterised protein [Grimontia hollisae]